MATIELPSQSSRVNRRCTALIETARLGQHGAEGIVLARSVGVNILTRLMLGDGLEFARHLEIDLEGFQNGSFELRPGLESCNLAKIMAEVFGLKDPRTDAKWLEQTRKDLGSATDILRRLGAGKRTSALRTKLAINFLKTCGENYERVANQATEEVLRINIMQLDPEKKDMSLEKDLKVANETLTSPDQAIRLQQLQVQFSEGQLGLSAAEIHDRLGISTIANPNYLQKV